MKRILPTGAPGPFKTNLRHSHRVSHPSTSWEEWVDGKGASAFNWKKQFKLAGIVASILALLGLAIGLFIELS
ncbi:MAG: hypothetical protein HC845_02835 [Akkermansiaceae bacterium]|nr:hypothetical protein [Akkermansiaceae bacterium]